MDELIKVKPDAMHFDELMLKIRNGHIRIPDFQREFVWERSQIISLLDSVYQHFPIGSFLFWQTEDDIQSYRHVGEVELRTDKGKAVQYVLDGQQRITSLFASLEQAKIAHRVNGKKVTKTLAIYFDLDDEQFVAKPFAKDHEKKRYRYAGLNQITSSNDILLFLVGLLSEVMQEEPTEQDLIAWMMKELNVVERGAKHFHVRFQAMDLYRVNHGVCTVTDAGREVATNRSLRPVLRGFINSIDYVEEMLPEIVQRGETTEEEMVKYLSETHNLEVRKWKVRCRLKWLAGLGFGTSRGRRLVLNDEGKAIIDEVLREIEIRQRDSQEHEEDKRERYFSVLQITDVDKFVEAAADLGKERRAALLKVRQRFTSYPFSLIYVFEQPIDTACEIFERINTSGKVLNVVDLMVAKSWSPTFNMREKLTEFRKELEKQGYEDLPDITILQCIAGVIQEAVQRKDILSIEKGIIELKWESVLESIRQAIDFLKANLKITHAKILPYNSLLVPLAYLFHQVEGKRLNDNLRTVLVQWFWKASVSNRYDGAAETKLGDDIAQMSKLAKGEDARFNYVSPPLSADRIVEQRLNLGSAFCKTVLCILNCRGPQEFKDSSPVTLTSFSKFNAAELHHLFPQAYLRKHDREHFSERHSMANIAMARASANKEYSNKPPSKYLAACKNPNLTKVLKSHFISDAEDSGIKKDEFETFLEYRAECILQEMRQLTGQMTEVESDFSGDEARALEKFELRIRELIHSKLHASDLEYWGKTGSPEFRGKIEERIETWLKTNPGRQRTEAREIDFCQILEYFRMVKSHWEVFSDTFKSRTDLEMHLKNVSNFRNALMHNREIDPATRQLALGSLSWFDEVFKAAVK